MNNTEQAARWQRMMDATEEYLRNPGRALSQEQVWDAWSVIEEARMHRDHHLRKATASA